MSADDRRQLREQISQRARELHPYAGNGVQARLPKFGDALTRREREVLCAAAMGLTYDETGEQLGIGEATVKHYSKTLRVKLGARTIAQATAIGQARGFYWITVDETLVA